MGGLKQFVGSSVIASGLLFSAGCGSGCDWIASITGFSATEHADEHPHDQSISDAHDESAHTHVGPNGGRLIVLGDEDYHAELTIDHGTAIARVCLLDRTGRKPVAVEQRELTLNIRSHGQPHQITLLPVDAAVSDDGLSSCFEGASELLRGDCEIDGRLNVIIHGKPYSGRVAHHADDHVLTR